MIRRCGYVDFTHGGVKMAQELRPIGTNYAIRVKGTQRYIPTATRGSHSRAGISEFEPVETDTPMLYRSAKAANSALVQWLKGVQKQGYDVLGEGPDEMVRFAMQITPVASRVAAEMEIVPVSLMVEA